MELKPEDKVDGTAPPVAAAAPSIPPETFTDLSRERSWGEKYKAKVVHFTRDWVLNYFVNFLVGASTTFAFDTSRMGTWFRGKSAAWSDSLGDHGIPRGLSKFMINFAVRTQLLLMGGHAMLPILKWMKDHKNRLEFRVGHMLDLLQEFVGRGNEASKRSIEEYNRVSSLVSIGNHNEKERDGIPVPELSEHDRELLEKHKVNEKLQFIERPLSWGKLLKARLMGMSFTTLTSIILSLSSHPATPKALRFEKTYEEPAGKFLGDKVISRIPLVSRIFNRSAVMTDTLKPGETALTGHQLIGKYFVDDALFTAASKTGFDLMERRHARKEAAQEAKEEAQEEKRSVNAMKKMSAPSPEAAARKNILNDPPKGFRAREDARPAEPALAVS